MRVAIDWARGSGWPWAALVAAAVLLGTATAGAQTTAPVLMWGEVLGAAPPTLELVLQDDSGRSVATVSTSLTSEGGRRYHSANWPGDAVRQALAAGTPLRLDVRPPGGGSSGKPLSLEPGSPLPAVVHVVDGGPALPQTWITLAHAELDSAAAESALTLTAVLAHAGSSNVRGTLRWKASEEAPPIAGVTLELAADSLQVCSVTTSAAAGVTATAVWTVFFDADDPAVPGVFRRVRPHDSPRAFVDRVGPGPALPEADELTVAKGAAALGPSALQLAAGQYLELHLECAGTTRGAVASTLTSWTLAGAGGTSPATGSSFGLEESTLAPLPGGGVWLEALWMAGAELDLKSPVLRGPSGATLPGQWRVRYLGRHDTYSPGGSY
ncbi:MAG: hypothetical protein HY814_06825 [Candidatus Riflebacteria bacterium]|nr:hypothetical protein [Candidatus Riflebacteria bacterium]